MTQPTKPWTAEDLAQLRKLRGEGMHFDLIAAAMDRHKASVTRKAKEIGLTTPADLRGPRPEAKMGPKPKAEPVEPARSHKAQPLKDDAVTLPLLPSLHPQLRAYIACTPNGTGIAATIRPTADEAWRELRASLSEPDTLIDRGWHICRCLVILAEPLDDPPPADLIEAYSG